MYLQRKYKLGIHELRGAYFLMVLWEVHHNLKSMSVFSMVLVFGVVKH